LRQYNPHEPSMNHEQVSQLCFEESYTVPSEQTARSLFTRLPHGVILARKVANFFVIDQGFLLVG